MRNNKWKFFMYGIGSLVIVWEIIYILPVDQKGKQAYFENERPLVMAHQGGAALAPTSTMEAFRLAAELEVDVIEFDVHYWTINNRETMHHLLDIGADGIITDHPDVLLDVLAERGY